MSAVATAIAASAVVGAISSSNAASDQASAANNATDATNARYQQTRADLLPFAQAGQHQLTPLNAFLNNPDNMSFTAQDFNKNLDPSYQWQLQQGQQALQNSQAAQDGVLSGAALKQMQGFTQGMASTNYQNAYNNWLNTTNTDYNRMQGMASLGENAAAQTGSIGANLANTSANSVMSAGNAAAAAQMGIANAFGGAANNYLGYMMLNKMMPGTGGS
jgi:hypothetical protein